MKLLIKVNANSIYEIHLKICWFLKREKVQLGIIFLTLLLLSHYYLKCETGNASLSNRHQKKYKKYFQRNLKRIFKTNKQMNCPLAITFFIIRILIPILDIQFWVSLWYPYNPNNTKHQYSNRVWFDKGFRKGKTFFTILKPFLDRYLYIQYWVLVWQSLIPNTQHEG